MVLLKVKLGPKGQVLIPKILRDAHHLTPGKEVVLKESNNGVLIASVDVNVIPFLEHLAEKSARLHGKKNYSVHDITKQYEKRASRAGIRL